MPSTFDRVFGATRPTDPILKSRVLMVIIGAASVMPYPEMTGSMRQDKARALLSGSVMYLGVSVGVDKAHRPVFWAFSRAHRYTR